MEEAAALIIQCKWEGVLAGKGASLCTGLPAALAHWDSFDAGGWGAGPPRQSRLPSRHLPAVLAAGLVWARAALPSALQESCLHAHSCTWLLQHSRPAL